MLKCCLFLSLVVVCGPPELSAEADEVLVLRNGLPGARQLAQEDPHVYPLHPVLSLPGAGLPYFS